MKKKIKISDFNGKEKEFEINVRNEQHFQIQLKNPSRIFKNKKKYSRKIKHKGGSLDV